MIRRSLARLARMDAAEIGWRLRTSGRTMIDRARAGIVEPQWRRERLAPALASLPELGEVRGALAQHDWSEAHRALSRHFMRAPQRFVLAAPAKAAVVDAIHRRFRASTRQAAIRGDRILAGDYRLLGYRALRFDGHDSGSDAIDWHLDPVHERRPPRAFWSAVPYLEPASGDHKIIWELNRHQQWLALGRAYWLTGDAKYRERFVVELASWLRANPPLVGINWASMLELALRTHSWLWALAFFADEASASDATPWTVDLLAALDRQLTQIERNLSHYFSPNTHLLGEALALYVAGCALPELAASPRRQALGRRVLLAEIGRQIGSDGGHLERSTHYHRYTLDFYALALAIARLNGDPAAAQFASATERLAAAARLLADDRGRLPHIGDDDGGALFPISGRVPDDARDSLAIAAALVNRADLQIGEVPEEVSWMLGHPLTHERTVSAGASPRHRTHLASSALVETGYYVSRTAGSDHVVIDGGPHGYQNGGHAHADALSLTLSVHGTPLLIDPGTGCYTTDRAIRDRFRSTALHNALTIDDRPQSIPAGPFHWARAADGRVHRWRTNPHFDYFDGEHDGYAPVRHRRCVLALHGDLLIVADFIDGAGRHAAATHWQIDPRWNVQIDGCRATFARERTRVGFAASDGPIESFRADRQTGLGWHSPVYGRVEPATTLRVRRHGSPPFWMVSVFGLDPRNPLLDVQTLQRYAAAPARSLEARITRASSVDYFAVGAPGVDRLAAGDLETDAAMFFYRTTEALPVARLALVDGSDVRQRTGNGVHLDFQRVLPDYFDTFEASHDREHSQDQPTCVASPVL
jgi:Heparinase II/III-like protein/Heparinase II/III N-terminus